MGELTGKVRVRLLLQAATMILNMPKIFRLSIILQLLGTSKTLLLHRKVKLIGHHQNFQGEIDDQLTSVHIFGDLKFIGQIRHHKQESLVLTPHN